VDSTKLKALTFFGIWLDPDACAILGRSSRGLHVLELHKCVLSDVQQYAEAAGTNGFGPRKIIHRGCLSSQNDEFSHNDFSSLIVPLLCNPRLKILHLYQSFESIGNLENVKAALGSNQSLKQLEIRTNLSIGHSDQLNLLLQGIAAASKLHTVCLHLRDFNILVSAEQRSEMVAKAMKECNTSSLVNFIDTYHLERCYWHKATNWNQEVLSILDFNRERCLFQENKNRNSQAQQLMSAFEIAESADNHHFRFWLVRNYANRLCGGESEPGPSPSSKRQKTLDNDEPSVYFYISKCIFIFVE
jgi:hypothetical protein